MAHEHSHDHGEMKFEKSEASDAALAAIRDSFPTLAENLELSRRFGELTAEEKARLVATQRTVEGTEGWKPGFHSDGDLCAGCAKPVEPLFSDVFESGMLRYAAFFYDLPVHPTSACVDAVRARFPRPAPQIIDRARRETMRDGGRPSARLAMFFRHDVLAHPPFGLEDWANSVAAANPGGFDRAQMKDMERLLMWVHATLFHH